MKLLFTSDESNHIAPYRYSFTAHQTVRRGKWIDSIDLLRLMIRGDSRYFQSNRQVS
ncbi:MAG: hypothetical protein ABFC78_05665 [Methanoregula sp.]